MKLSFSDLSQVKWKAQGSSRNQSSWMDSTELVVSYFRGEEVLDTRADLDAVSVGGFTVRLTVTPLKVDKMVLYGGILPLSKEDLEAKLAEEEVDMDSPNIRTVALKLWQAKGRPHNGFPFSFSFSFIYET